MKTVLTFVVVGFVGYQALKLVKSAAENAATGAGQKAVQDAEDAFKSLVSSLAKLPGQALDGLSNWLGSGAPAAGFSSSGAPTKAAKSGGGFGGGGGGAFP